MSREFSQSVYLVDHSLESGKTLLMGHVLEFFAENTEEKAEKTLRHKLRVFAHMSIDLGI